MEATLRVERREGGQAGTGQVAAKADRPTAGREEPPFTQRGESCAHPARLHERRKAAGRAAFVAVLAKRPTTPTRTERIDYYAELADAPGQAALKKRGRRGCRGTCNRSRYLP